MQTMTADAIALRILLADTSPDAIAPRLAALGRAVDTMLGHRCPECDAGRDEIEDNGETGSRASFRCDACGHGWDAVQP